MFTHYMFEDDRRAVIQAKVTENISPPIASPPCLNRDNYEPYFSIAKNPNSNLVHIFSRFLMIIY